MTIVARLFSNGTLKAGLFDELSGTSSNVGVTSEGIFYSTEMKEGTASNLSSSTPMRITDDKKLLVYDSFDEFNSISVNTLRFKYYAYGSAIGDFEIYWDDGTTLNGPLTFIANGSSVTSISGQQQTGMRQLWRDASCDLSSFSGDTGRVVFKYVSGSNFTGDFQLDDIELDHSGGTADLDPDLKRTASTDNWEQAKASATYSLATFTTVTVNTGTDTFWNYDPGGTGSGNTGNDLDSDGSNVGYYLYTEVSSPNFSNVTGWLRTINTYTLQ